MIKDAHWLSDSESRLADMLAVKHFNSKLHITPRAKIKFIVIVSIVQCVNPVQRETSLKHPDTFNQNQQLCLTEEAAQL